MACQGCSSHHDDQGSTTLPDGLGAWSASSPSLEDDSPAASALGSNDGWWSAPVLRNWGDDAMELAAVELQRLLAPAKASMNPFLVTYSRPGREASEEVTVYGEEAGEEITIYGDANEKPLTEEGGASTPGSFGTGHGLPGGHVSGGGSTGGGYEGDGGSGQGTTAPTPTDAQYWYDAWSDLDCGALQALMTAVHSSYELIWVALHVDALGGSEKAKAILNSLRGNAPSNGALQAFWTRARIVNRQYMVLLRLCCAKGCGCCGDMSDYIPLDEELVG